MCTGRSLHVGPQAAPTVMPPSQLERARPCVARPAGSSTDAETRGAMAGTLTTPDIADTQSAGSRPARARRDRLMTLRIACLCSAAAASERLRRSHPAGNQGRRYDRSDMCSVQVLELRRAARRRPRTSTGHLHRRGPLPVIATAVLRRLCDRVAAVKSHLRVSRRAPAGQGAVRSSRRASCASRNVRPADRGVNRTENADCRRGGTRGGAACAVSPHLARSRRANPQRIEGLADRIPYPPPTKRRRTASHRHRAALAISRGVLRSLAGEFP
jgi:hypothetical protein